MALPIDKNLCEPGERACHGYFPTTAVISLVTPITGNGAEVAVVGSEGMIGFSLALAGEAAQGPTCRPVVASPGDAYRMRADVVVGEFRSCIEMQRLLLRYTQAVITHITQTVACNRHHSVGQQVGRWLLHRLDRSPGRELCTTQQRMANLLGVRRESVTGAVQELQRAGIIRYTRCRITVLNRSELERRACECYAVIAKEQARLLAALIGRRELIA